MGDFKEGVASGLWFVAHVIVPVATVVGLLLGIVILVMIIAVCIRGLNARLSSSSTSQEINPGVWGDPHPQPTPSPGENDRFSQAPGFEGYKIMGIVVVFVVAMAMFLRMIWVCLGTS